MLSIIAYLIAIIALVDLLVVLTRRQARRRNTYQQRRREQLDACVRFGRVRRNL